ncbi:hypothetical protein B9S53_08505 [Arthrospira sp. O9.13F]|nr:hypothetical protein B9S53_08505 [Arthrospira sp. O9.13F]
MGILANIVAWENVGAYITSILIPPSPWQSGEKTPEVSISQHPRLKHRGFVPPFQVADQL